ncbi:FAD-linked oxidase C-terminal domain-containing protein [Luteitalea sp.]|uniref:FAD-binding oxidoreductase n=1 Tax=Luteitalea sp. TaxID=2004800 RepID=UPI003459D276
MPDECLAALRARFGDRCSTVLSVREQHGRDESPFTHVPPPAAVVFAESTQDVADAVRLASASRVPVIPYGAGSSLEGHLLAVHGGLSLDVSRMARIVATHAEDMTITVQPGVTRTAVNRALEGKGLFFPVDPGADASLGGMCATRASGTNAVRYGTMRDNVLALEVVTAGGDVIRTGTRARKSSAGYDLTRLMIGSEGTLGVITEITLRLHPLPESVAAATCSFAGIAPAVRTAMAIIQAGIPIARCELIDTHTVRMVNAHSRLTLPEQPMLLMEFHGSATDVADQARLTEALALEQGGEAFAWTTTPEERTRLWTARHNAYFAAVHAYPGRRIISTDTCVPISRLADCLLGSAAEAEATGLPHYLLGHVGDGNFHFGYVIDPENTDDWRVAEALNQTLVRRALALGGTCSGEHGIGLHKMRFLVEEAGDGAIAMMRAIKQALDPLGIMNPGKIFEI